MKKSDIELMLMLCIAIGLHVAAYMKSVDNAKVRREILATMDRAIAKLEGAIWEVRDGK